MYPYSNWFISLNTETFMSPLDVGVTEALYLDMGYGWNYSWYRDENGVAHEIHKYKGKYITNWITFYCNQKHPAR